MKKIPLYLLLTLSLLFTGGCHTELDNDIEALTRRIEKLEKRCAEMNTTLQGLQTLVNKLQENDYVTRVETIYDGNTIIGYTLCFTHSDPITLYNGTDAGTPELGLGLGEDGIYYWTVKYPGDEQATFITDNFGVRLPASAHSPQLKIENGYWMVTYDGGEIWYNLGKATGEDGKSFFDSISQSGDYIQFSLLNGTEISIPTWDSFDKLQQAYTQTYRNLVSFVTLSNHFLDKVSVSGVLPIVHGEETIGYQLVLTEGSTYDFYNGTTTNIPTILAESKGRELYWAIRYGNDPDFEWILDENGEMVRADAPEGLIPKISLKRQYGVDNKYYWAIAYGNQEPQFLLYNGEMVPASAQAPDPVIKSIVEVLEDRVRITLSDKQEIYIPLAHAFSLSLSSPVIDNTLMMAPSDTLSFTCQIPQANQQFTLLPVTHDDFYAEATRTSDTGWDVRVISPASFVAPMTSRLDLLVSDGRGSMKNVVVTILTN